MVCTLGAFVGVFLERASGGESVGEGALVLVGAAALAVPMIAAQCWFLAMDGQSLGKKALGLRIVNAGGETPGWTRTILAREGCGWALASCRS